MGDSAAWPFVTILAAGCLVGSVLAGWPILAQLGYLLIALLLLGFIVTQVGARGLEIQVTVRDTRLVTGDTVQEEYLLNARKRWLPLWLHIAAATEADGRHVYELFLHGRTPARISIDRTLNRRGRIFLGTGPVTVRDPLGLFQVAMRMPGPIATTVYPRPIPIPDDLWQLVVRKRAEPAAEMDPAAGILRPYVPGDSPSRVHWRSSARHGSLMVTDPAPPHSQIIWLLVDLGFEPGEQDRAPGIATYIADRLSAAGESVGLVLVGETIIKVSPRAPHSDISRILDALATTPSAAGSRLEQVVQTAKDYREAAALILITPAAISQYPSRSRGSHAPRTVGISTSSPHRVECLR